MILTTLILLYSVLVRDTGIEFAVLPEDASMLVLIHIPKASALDHQVSKCGFTTGRPSNSSRSGREI